ncbi:stage II sporulation E family protein, partial [Chlamydia psittaci 84-8471/1]
WNSKLLIFHLNEDL